MASTPELRLQRIERLLDADTSSRRGYSWRQLVYLASGATTQEVGPPERVARPGAPTLEELVTRGTSPAVR